MMGATDEWGILHPCTVLQVENCFVTQVKRKEVEGYNAIQVGSGLKNARRLNRPDSGHLAKAGVPPVRKLVEFRVTKKSLLPLGTQLFASHFIVGQKVDVTGTTIGKGTQGAMKRWGFSGLPASHGVSLTHRSIGATGARQDPGKVWKGKKMAGRMGFKQRTTLGLKIFQIDTVMDCLLLVGCVPGPKNGLVIVRDAVGYKFEKAPPFPTFFPKKINTFQETVQRASNPQPLVPEKTEDDVPKEYEQFMKIAYPLKLNKDVILKLEAIKVKYRQEILQGKVGPIIRKEFPEWLPNPEEKGLFDRANKLHSEKEKARREEISKKWNFEKKKTHSLDESLKEKMEKSSRYHESVVEGEMQLKEVGIKKDTNLKIKPVVKKMKGFTQREIHKKMKLEQNKRKQKK